MVTYDTVINDHFIIDIRFIDNGKEHTTSIYVLDASLDKRVDRLENGLKNREDSTNYNIIGIGHIQFRNALRKRDFAPPDDTSFFGIDARFQGRADLFLTFITDSIVLKYDSLATKRVLIGHSFGGIFGVYVSTFVSQPFDEIYALSPALWVNHRSFAKHYTATDSLYIRTPLHISYGSLEQLNLIAPTIRHFRSSLKEKDESMVTIQSIKSKTHFSIMKEMPNFIF
jgi:predicted alpha/beta superfamily hydrolase